MNKSLKISVHNSNLQNIHNKNRGREERKDSSVVASLINEVIYLKQRAQDRLHEEVVF